MIALLLRSIYRITFLIGGLFYLWWLFVWNSYLAVPEMRKNHFGIEKWDFQTYFTWVANHPGFQGIILALLLILLLVVLYRFRKKAYYSKVLLIGLAVLIALPLYEGVSEFTVLVKSIMTGEGLQALPPALKVSFDLSVSDICSKREWTAFDISACLIDINNILYPAFASLAFCISLLFGLLFSYRFYKQRFSALETHSSINGSEVLVSEKATTPHVFWALKRWKLRKFMIMPKAFQELLTFASKRLPADVNSLDTRREALRHFILEHERAHLQDKETFMLSLGIPILHAMKVLLIATFAFLGLYVVLSYLHYTLFKSGSDASYGGVSIELDSKDRLHLAASEEYNDCGFLKYISFSETPPETFTPSEDCLLSLLSVTPGMDLDRQDRAHIVYYDDSSKELRYAHNTEEGWQIGTVHKYGELGFLKIPLAVDQSANPHLLIRADHAPQEQNGEADTSERPLEYLTRIGGTWFYERIAEEVAFYDITLDATNTPHIAFTTSEPVTANSAEKRSSLVYGTRINGQWIFQTVDSFVGYLLASSIALDNSDGVHIAYVAEADQRNYGVIRYATNESGPWTITTLSEKSAVNPSLAVDTANKAHVSYFDWINNALMYASNASGNWQLQTVDDDWLGIVGLHSAIAVGQNDQPQVVYSSGRSLKYAVLANGNWKSHIIEQAPSGLQVVPTVLFWFLIGTQLAIWNGETVYWVIPAVLLCYLLSQGLMLALMRVHEYRADNVAAQKTHETFIGDDEQLESALYQDFESYLILANICSQKAPLSFGSRLKGLIRNASVKTPTGFRKGVDWLLEIVSPHPSAYKRITEMKKLSS